MKANKVKTSKKSDKKLRKREEKTELAASITQRFLEAVKGLGLDAGKFTKDIQKTSKLLARKLSDKYGKLKTKVAEQTGPDNIKAAPNKLKRPVRSAKNAPASIVKAQKVVATAVAKTASARSARNSSSATSAVDPQELAMQLANKNTDPIKHTKTQTTTTRKRSQGQVKNSSKPSSREVSISEDVPKQTPSDMTANSTQEVKKLNGTAARNTSNRAGGRSKKEQGKAQVTPNKESSDPGTDYPKPNADEDI